jgi:hypothetical protein
VPPDNGAVVQALFTVAVCAVESSFVQTITSPTLAVTLSGEKAKFLIVTVAAPVAPAAATVQNPAADDGDSAAADGLEPPADGLEAADGLEPAAEAAGDVVAALLPQAARAIVTRRTSKVKVRRRMPWCLQLGWPDLGAG